MKIDSEDELCYYEYIK